MFHLSHPIVIRHFCVLRCPVTEQSSPLLVSNVDNSYISNAAREQRGTAALPLENNVISQSVNVRLKL